MPEITSNHINIAEMPFQELYTTYGSLVYNTALSLLQNIQDAEEVTQDVFVNVYLKRKDYRAEAAFTTWLYRITTNTALDMLKAGKRKKRFARLTNLFDTTSNKLRYDYPDFNHPGIIAEKKESAGVLFRAIAQLPLKQQSAVVLTQIEGLSYQKTAKVMQTTTSAIESLVVRAKRNLKEILSDYYNEYSST